MDRALFISMTGAKSSMQELEVMTNNLANLNTTAYRADSTFMQQQAVDPNNPQQSRTYSKVAKTYTDFTQGSIFNTERDLDIALDGSGFIAVQSKTGKEGYTRAGGLILNPDGTLATESGALVMGNAGTVSLPPADKISIASDGTISVRFVGNNEMVPVDRIKLVNPPVNQLTKGTDSLFYLQNDAVAGQDNDVKIISGALEGSNVSAIDTMTQIIDLSRHYEIHTNFMKTFSEDSVKSNQLLELTR